MTKETRPAVAAAIFNEQGEILLQKRRDVNKWCIISGRLEFGETVEEAMLREILEETDTPARLTRLIGIYSSPASQTYHYAAKTVQYVTSYFEARLEANPEAGFSNKETSELRFFRPDELPGELALINDYWLSDALDKNGTVFVR